MSEIKVNKITPKQNCTQVTLGDSGDTFVIPSGVTITNNGTQTGFGRTGTVDWDTTAKTASFTAVSGNGYFVDTTSTAITVTLPAGSAGDIVSLADYAATWQTNNVTVTPNGSDNIGGANANVTLSTEGQSVTFVYVDSTQGWVNVQDSTSNERANPFVIATGGTITTCGNDKIHTFTGPGTFTVTAAAACAANNVVSYMVIAGGGAGGSSSPSDGSGGGGGGAGGFREYKSPVTPYTASPLDGNPGGTAITVTAQGYPITVGGGGSGVPAPVTPNAGNNGNPSVFSTITSTAGGGGGGGANPTSPTGKNGGSGGGAGNNSGTGTAGSGNTPPVNPPQGNNGGGISPPGTTPNYGSGGGGGATGAGQTGSNLYGGPGGNGATTSINGTPTTRAGGGGGGVYAGGVPFAGDGGPGGGGDGGGGSSRAATAGATNTGSGGGGLSFSACTSGNGGSGIVIIRYKYQ